MPARLADGLDQGSDLKIGCPVFLRPIRPVKDGRLGPPRQPAGRRAGFGCNVSYRDMGTTWPRPMQRQIKTAAKSVKKLLRFNLKALLTIQAAHWLQHYTCS